MSVAKEYGPELAKYLNAAIGSMTMKELAEKLKYPPGGLQGRSGRPKRELERNHYGAQYVWQIFRGTRLPSRWMVSELARVLKLDLDVLYVLAGYPPPWLVVAARRDSATVARLLRGVQHELGHDAAERGDPPPTGQAYAL
jgi:hypothetical protein